MFKDSSSYILKFVYYNTNVIFKIKILKDYYFDKYLKQLKKASLVLGIRKFILEKLIFVKLNIFNLNKFLELAKFFNF